MQHDIEQIVDMTDVIGNLALECGLPYMSLDNLVELGKHTKRVYNLDAKRITVKQLFQYIHDFVSTSFGYKIYTQLSYK